MNQVITTSDKRKVLSPGSEIAPIQFPNGQNSQLPRRLSRKNIKNLSTPVVLKKEYEKVDDIESTPPKATEIVKKTYKESGNVMVSIENSIQDGFSIVKDYFSNNLSKSTGLKQIIAGVAGLALFAKGVLEGGKNLLDTIKGKNTGKFNFGETIFYGMLGWLGFNGMQYAQGKNDIFDHLDKTFKNIAPLLTTGVLNNIIGKPNSSSSKIADLVGLKSPLENLTGSLTNALNPRTYFGEKATNGQVGS